MEQVGDDVEGTTYVQLAGRAVFDGTSLTLLDLAPATVCQSPPPASGLGYLPTGLFLDRWYENGSGPGTRAVPAVLSLLDPDSSQVHDAQLSLALPRIRGTGLEYQVRVVVGTLPVAAGACVLFISPRGRPVTPPRRVSTASVDTPSGHR